MEHIKCSELLKRAGIGSHVFVKREEGLSIPGELYGISADCIQFKDDVGMTETIPLKDISLLKMIDPLPVYSIINSEKLNDFMLQKNKIAIQARLNLLDYYQAELLLLTEAIPALSDFWSVKKLANLPYLSAEIKGKCIEEIETTAQIAGLSADVVRVALTLVDFAAKDFASCSSRYISKILDDNFKDELPLSFLYNQMHDQNQCFFWMTQYFLRIIGENNFDSPLWWYCLQQSTILESYEEISTLLKTVLQKNLLLAAESIAYLFVLNGRRTPASSLLALTGSEEDAFDICEYYCSQLRSDPDNQYHRYLRCFKEIISKRLLTKYEQYEGICGYVYDFVPSRAYGNILGYDLLRYFFHSNESNCSQFARNTIKKNICTLKPVAEEELVMVTFYRNGDAKRTYEALNVV